MTRSRESRVLLEKGPGREWGFPPSLPFREGGREGTPSPFPRERVGAVRERVKLNRR
jgi:hypothetical protein